MTWIVFLIAFAGLVVWLWLVSRSLHKIHRQLDDAESRLARRFYTLQGRLTEMDSIVRELDFERRRAAGEIRFTADMPVAMTI